MSETSGSDYIYIPTFAEHVMAQDFEQQLALMGFYRAYCEKRIERQSDANQDGRQGKFPAVLGHIWTIDEVLYAINATEDAFENPADYLLMAAHVDNGTVATEELDVLRVSHIPIGRHDGIDKIIDAEWPHQPGRFTTIQIGHHTSVLSRNSSGKITYSPPIR